jgi:F-type H+-transporting ATPase subunit epsilon
VASITFRLITPEREVYSDTVDQVSLPTKLGEITVLPQHIPLVSALAPGELCLRKGPEEFYFAVSGGFVEVAPGNEVSVLADTAERDIEIDEDRAEEARRRATELRTERRADAQEFVALSARIEKELARLRVIRRRRRGQSPTPGPRPGHA